MRQDRRALALAGVLSLTLAAAAQAAPDRISIPGEHTFPESITSTSDGALYIGSLGDGVVFRVPPGGATAEPFLPKAEGGMAVLGVLADEGSGTLWVCHSDLAVFGETGGKAATLQAYDLRSGGHKASYPYHPSVPPDAPERWQRDQELKETLDASQAALEEGGPAAGHLPRPLPRGFFSAGRG
jgi:hypothetical protein